MQIERVIGGVDGDATAQAIQLRMRFAGQQFVSASRIRAWNADGSSRVTVVNMGTNVLIGNLGSRVLIASANFLAKTSPTTVPDFTMTTLIPESFLAAGSLTFESNSGIIYWRLSWGGANYTGLTTGLTTNDLDGNFGPPWPGALPTGFQALVFQGSASALSTTNAADYALSTGVGVFTNNLTTSFSIVNTLSAAGSLPAGTQLHQNYPNPFNPETVISFSMEAPGRVTVSVFDPMGRSVTTLWDGEAAQGLNEIRWDGRNARGEVVATGMYFYRLQSQGFSQVRKMVLLK